MQPGNLRAKTMYAISIGQLGRLDEAVRILRELVAENPTGLEPLNYLAVFLRTGGRFEEAAEISRRIIELAPDRLDGHRNLGLSLLGLKRFVEAAESFERTIQIGPRVAMHHHGMALAFEGAGRPVDAERSLRKALALEPGNQESLDLLLHLLTDMDRGAEAAPFLRRAHDLDPDSSTGQMNLATAYLEEAKPGAALDPLQRAIELTPGSAEAHERMGATLRQLGRFEEAETYLRKAIELDPDRSQPYFELAYCAKITEHERPLVDQLRGFAKRTDLRVNALANVHYALGKAFDDLEEFESAIREFEEANRMMFEVRRNSFNPAVQQAIYDRVKNLVDRGFFEKQEGVGSSSELPVFIVGMIRSGTTLTEQILSSHPEIGAGGEQMFWLNDKIGVAHSPNPAASRDRIRTLGNAYLKVMGEIAPGMPRVTDKQPLNYSHLGLIHLALPKARIIHCRRNPVDTCLSIYTTPYHGGLRWGHDKERIVGVYRDYQRLMDLWRRVLPPEVLLEVDYEELVTDREKVARRMIEFVGLDWNEACLSPEENIRAVTTPSQWQVRQPVYTSSVERWRRYEPWLGPFRELLTPAELSSIGS